MLASMRFDLAKQTQFWIAAVTVVLLLIAGSDVKAVAADADVDLDYSTYSGDGGATVYLRAEDSGTEAAGPVSGSSSHPDDADPARCVHLGEEIACQSEKGYWSNDLQCYVKLMPTQVTPDRPYRGHTDGAVYWCRTPLPSGGGRLGVGAGSAYFFWGPGPGSAGAPMVADPRQVAQIAIEQMDLEAPRIGMTPLRAGAPLLVGVDAWFWVDNAGQRGLGPVTRTATAGATTVRATARVTDVLWELGDGTTITCPSSGTPWTPDKGTGPSPTCGHRYVTPSASEPNGTYTVRATAHWSVDWSGSGESGTIPLSLSGVREQEVIEVQVLQTR